MLKARKIEDGNIRRKVYEFDFTNDQVFHLKNFYKFTHEYLYDELYRGMADENKVPEVLYVDKKLQVGLKEHRIWWRWRKYPTVGNKNVAFYLDINWLTLAMSETQTVVKGEKKVKANSGEVTLKVIAYLDIKDFKELESKDSFLKKFQFFGVLYRKFRHRLYRPIWDQYRMQLIGEMQKLQEELKQYQDLTGYTPPKEIFHMKKGL